VQQGGETPPPEPGLLHAEDLRRGVRIDVREGLGPWWSLHRRRTTLTVGGVERAYEAEGMLTTGATRKPGEAGRLYLTEVLARWSGWSLSVPQPGNPLAEDNSQAIAEGSEVLNEPDPAFPARFAHQVVPGSLPRLRFGRTYQLRARAVDLADTDLPPGGGQAVQLPVDALPGAGSPSSTTVTPPVPFLRWEPIPAPAMLPQAPRDEGGSLTRIVLRSDHDQDPGQPSPDPAIPFVYARDSQRWLTAPVATPELVERHGALDDGAGFRADAHAILADRTDAAFEQVADVVRDPANYYRVYYPGPDGGLPALPVPHLPDPLAASLAVRGLPGRADDDPLLLPFSTDAGWPTTQPVHLILLASPDEVAADDGPDGGAHVLRIRLPKATRLRLPVSCALPGAGDAGEQLRLLELLAVWRGLVERGEEPDDLLAATGGRRGRARAWSTA
jgi:hypothetical protein